MGRPKYFNGTEWVDIAPSAEEFDAHQADLMYKTAGGTDTEITLTIETLTAGYSKTFIASANNNGAETTINGKPLYKPNTTEAPTLIVGKAYTVWYDQSSDCFFIKASAEGTATVNKVLAGETFSNDSDTGLQGTMPNNGAFNLGLGVTVPEGYYSGGTTASGKQWASGSITNTTELSSFAYGPYGGAFVNKCFVEVIISLGFIPSTIMIYSSDGFALTSFHKNIPQSSTGYKFQINIAKDSNAYPLVSPAYANANGFKLPVDFPSKTYTWVAYE